MVFGLANPLQDKPLVLMRTIQSCQHIGCFVMDKFHSVQYKTFTLIMFHGIQVCYLIVFYSSLVIINNNHM